MGSGHDIWAAGSAGEAIRLPAAEDARGSAGTVDAVMIELAERGKAGLVQRSDAQTGWDEGTVVARRESLCGDQRSGWRGTAESNELAEVHEDVQVLRRAGEPS